MEKKIRRSEINRIQELMLQDYVCQTDANLTIQDKVKIKMELMDQLGKFGDYSHELTKIIAYAYIRVNTKYIGKLYGWEIIEDEKDE